MEDRVVSWVKVAAFKSALRGEWRYQGLRRHLLGVNSFVEGVHFVFDGTQ
jgi:hypothetical protein